MKKFFAKVESFFKKAFGSSKWEKTASTVLTIVTPLLTTLLALTAGPSVAAAVGGVISQVQKNLAAASVLIDDLDAAGASATHTPQQVVAILGAARSDLSSILQLAEVKNSGKQAEITQVVNTIVDELDAIVAAAPAAVPAKV
jgi:hypothetical protein